MKVRRTLSLAASVALIAGLAVAASPAASAAGTSPACSALDGRHRTWIDVPGTGLADSFFDTGAFWAGDSITVTITTTSTGTPSAKLYVPIIDEIASGPIPGAIAGTVANQTPNGEGRVVISGLTGPSSGSLAYTCTSAVGIAAPAAIPDWIQAYGRGGPDEVCPTGYNPAWAGGPAGDVVRYTPSWEQWMNGGTGGWVCTRTIPSLG